jgi:hypothetical protein
MNENDIRSANTIVQDPTNPDVWYCGTGEVFYPPSESDISHGTFGWGIFKSNDNGVTWTKLRPPQPTANTNSAILTTWCTAWLYIPPPGIYTAPFTAGSYVPQTAG